MHSSKYKANLLAGILSAIFSMVMIDSFAQSELTTSQDQGSNVLPSQRRLAILCL